MKCRSFVIFFALLVSDQSLAKSNDCELSITVSTAIVPPIVYLKDGKVAGKVLRKVESYLANKVTDTTIKHANWARALRLAELGEVDAVFPTMYSDIRSEYLDFNTPKVSDVSLSLYKNLQKTIGIEEIDEQHSIAIVRSANIDKSMLNGAKLFEVVRFEQAVKMLESGRVDFALGVTEIVEHHIHSGKFTNIEHVKNLGSSPIYLALSKQSSNYKQLKSCLSHFSPID